MNELILQKANNIKHDIENLKELHKHFEVYNDPFVYIHTADMQLDDSGIVLDRVTKLRLYKLIQDRIQELTEEFNKL